MEAILQNNDHQPNGVASDPTQWVNMDQKALDKLQEEQVIKSLVTLGMVKVSESFAAQLKDNYQEYASSLKDGEAKLFKSEYYGRIMEESFDASINGLTDDLSGLADIHQKTLENIDKTQALLDQSGALHEKTEKSIRKNWIMLLVFTMISVLLVFLFFRIKRNKNE